MKLHTAMLVSGIVIGSAGIAIATYAWNSRGHWHEQSQRFQEEAEAARDSTKHWKERAAEADSAAEAQEDSTEAARARAEAAIRELQTLERKQRGLVTRLETDSVVRAVRDRYPRVDSLIQAQNNVIDSQDQQLTHQDSIIRSQDLLIMRLKAREATKDSVIASLENELQLSNEQKEEWRQEAKPGMLEFSFEELPKDIGLFLLGRLSGEVF